MILYVDQLWLNNTCPVFKKQHHNLGGSQSFKSLSTIIVLILTFPHGKTQNIHVKCIYGAHDLLPWVTQTSEYCPNKGISLIWKIHNACESKSIGL